MPISIDELNGMYDPTAGGGPGPKPKIVPPKANAPFDLSTLDAQPKSTLAIGAAKPTDVEDYGKYLDQGVFSDQDIESQRGQHQSVLNKVGHAIANLPLNTLGSLIEGVGDLGLLGGQWGDDRTYTNALIEAGKSLHNVSGDIYMRNQHNTVGATLSDPSWWIDQVAGLAEFGVSYAALGAGVGGALSKMAEAGSTALQAGKLGMQTGRMLGQLGTAGFMAYTMGAQNAGDVFKSTYDYQFKKLINSGMSPDEAQEAATHISAQSAATTAQLTTTIGTVLALGSMGAYFRKSSDAALDILKKEVPQQAGEDLTAWAARVRKLDPSAYESLLNPSKSTTHKLLESGKMGVEMQQLQFGHKTGEELGKEGKIKSFTDQFGELQNYLDRTMDKDGAIAFGIGAISGIGIDYLRENVIKSRWADELDKTTGQPIPKLDENGQPVELQRKLYTPKALSEMHSKAKFNTIKEAIAYDIDQFDKGQKSYLAAIKSGSTVDAQLERERMFNQHNVNVITSGVSDAWKQTYQEIANMEPAEAVQRGYTTTENDTSYKDAATKAASNIDKYQRMYDKLQQRYGSYYEQNQGFKPVIDGVFSRQVHLDSWEEMLKEHTSKLKELTNEEDQALSELYPKEPTRGYTAQQVRDLYSATQNARRLTQEQRSLKEAIDKQDSPTMSAYVREYMGIDYNSNNSKESLIKAAKRTHEHLSQTILDEQEKMDNHRENIKGQIPEGANFNEYVKDMIDNLPSVDYQHQIDLSRAKKDIAKQHLAEIIKEKNLTRMADKYSKYMEAEAKKADILEKQYNKELADRAKNNDLFDKKNEARRNAVAKRYAAAIDSELKEHNDNVDRYQKLKDELSILEGKGSSDWLRKLGLKKQMLALESRIKRNQENLTKYKEKYDKYYDPNASLQVTPPTITTNNITVTPPQGATIAPYIDTPDPQYEAVAEQVNNIIPDQQATKDFEDSIFKIADDNFTVKLALAQDKLTNIAIKHQQLRQDNEHLSNLFYDALEGRPVQADDLIKQGLTPTEVNDFLEAMNDYLKTIQEGLDNNSVEEFNKTTNELALNTDPETDTIDIDQPSDTPIIPLDDANAQAYTTPVDDGQGGITFGGAKTVNANTIANSTLGYFEFLPDHNKEINLISQKDQINQKTNPDVLLPNKLRPGTNIRLEVDTEYDGPKNIVGQLKQDEYGKVPQGHETFQDYSDEHGKVPADKMGNVPIKIVDTNTNKTIGYVRKHEWVTEKYEKDGSLRNIAERFDEEGNETNGAQQSKLILDIRKAVVDRYNQTGQHTTATTTTKGVGHPILNLEIKNATSHERSKPKPAYAFNNKDGGLLPDKKLQIVISDNGTLMSGKGFQFPKPIAGDTKDIRHGAVMVMLPGANGQHIPSPLIGKQLSEGEIPHRTISRVIELYLSYTGEEAHPITKEIRQLANRTGFDVSTERGLRNFINQYYTHTQRFDDTAMSPQDGQQANGKFLFNVWDKIEGKEGKAWIKAGMTGSGSRPILASLDANGKLSQEFSDILKEGLATRSKAVVYSRQDIRGINEPTDKDNPFTDALYRADGKWQHNTYSDYNEYVKAFSKTTAYGKNKIGDNYIYTANPSISYDVDGLTEVQRQIETNNKSTNISIPVADSHPYNESLANEMDEIFNASLPRERPTVKEIGTAPDKSKPLDIKNLEDLYTFTPEDQRNGKVPADVLRELSDRGHTFLPDGYNPFSLCL